MLIFDCQMLRNAYLKWRRRLRASYFKQGTFQFRYG
jgi:hypothetical protein